MTARYAVLVQERESTNVFGLPSGDGVKRHASLIKSMDNGITWHPVKITDEPDALRLAVALNQMEAETAIAALRYELDDKP